MTSYIISTLFSLGFILGSCYVFSNGVEWLGKHYKLGHGVVGSVLAAVGTALPETIIPIIAIIFHPGEAGMQIGIGAIAGAPFMLGTLAFFVTGSAVVFYTLLGRRSLKMNTDLNAISRDLTFFVIIYGMAVLTTFVHQFQVLKAVIAIALLLSYGVYLKKTFSADSEDIEDLDKLFLGKIFNHEETLFLIFLQIALSLAGIIFGAQLFIHFVKLLSDVMGIAPLILSIIITPIATELPEKLNSIIWTRQKKDTLALGNITGAMVFQSCFPVVFGMLLTPWVLKGITLLSAIIALVSASIYLAWIRITKRINPFLLMIGGIGYLIFLMAIFLR
ncbi:MAG TPA: sodium:calcium antiporter [Candidatus Cloacimonadota bacterium]|nr:sodium:calcium antiporter [Candidatus Cloacimonadota bacterium]HPT71157.1 sodium:calcium antiporter [Candidatus Cloacimonadota bacterium]